MAGGVRERTRGSAGDRTGDRTGVGGRARASAGRGARAGPRAGGGGSVYRRASDGRWVAALRLPTGRRVVRYATNERAARAKLAELWREHGAGRLSAPLSARGRPTPTLGEWWDTWLERKRPALRPKTLSVYQASAGKVVAELSGVRLARLSSALLAATFDRLRRAGVGSRTLEQAYTYLAACLRAAQAEGYLAGAVGAGPLWGVERPRHRPRERPRWTAAEAARFLARCEATQARRPLAALCALALLSGLRRGEILALRWRDVEWGERRLWVRRQRTPWGEGEPKTAAGVRAVPLSERAMGVLRQVWGRTERRGPDELVFRTRHGLPPHPDGVRKTLVRLCHEAGVPLMAVHDLRHAFAALALAGGLDPVALARVMGHSRPATSLTVYAYPLAVERAAESLDRLLGAGKGPRGTGAAAVRDALERDEG